MCVISAQVRLVAIFGAPLPVGLSRRTFHGVRDTHEAARHARHVPLDEEEVALRVDLSAGTGRAGGEGAGEGERGCVEGGGLKGKADGLGAARGVSASGDVGRTHLVDP